MVKLVSRPWWVYLVLVLVGTFIIVVLDIVWLGLLMSEFYAQIPGQGPVNVIAALLTWFFISLGLVLFVLPRAARWRAAAGWGVLFGFVMYAVYDLTNLAVLAGWPVVVVLVDIVWGAVLSGVTASVLYVVRGWLPFRG